MVQPQWVTSAGSLGVIPEGEFYQIPVQAIANGEDVFYQLIAGQLPQGIQVTTTGLVEGVPKNTITVQGVPTDVSQDITSKFAIRAYTLHSVNGTSVISRLADRTFTLTVTGQNVPEFVTPAGRIGSYYDGTEISLQVEFTDSDLQDNVVVKFLAGELPPGTVVSSTGLIHGLIAPLVGPPGTAAPGYDTTAKAEYPYDFTTRSTSKNYQFTLEITDGKDANVRTFEIFVYSKDSMTADTTDFTADNTFITADVVPTRTPVLLNPVGDLGRIRADNFYAYKVDAIDFDGDASEYMLQAGTSLGLPPGLSIDNNTGWLHGYIPDQGTTETNYQFAVRVFKKENPTIISDPYYFTITIIGNIDTEIVWLTESDLGSIYNGGISMFYVAAVNLVGGRSLQYRLVSGSNSKLPQGLTLQSSGHITGRVSFNTFALDGGATTFDTSINTRLIPNPTTFDLNFEFWVNAYAPVTESLGYSVNEIQLVDGGSGYSGQPTINISAPPESSSSIQATAGIATIVGGVITSIAVNNPGRGYLSAPSITIVGGSGSLASAVTTVTPSQISNAVSVVQKFSIQVVREFNSPYENLYIKAMPPVQDRELLTQLLQNQNIIPENVLYRSDDQNFGIASNVEYVHAFGLTAATVDEYVSALDENHYWKNLTLGEIKTAQAVDANGTVVYEVVYSEIIDDLVNKQGKSVSKSIKLPYPINEDDSTEIATVYPNSLINMRDQVIDVVGQISPALPLWMTSKQANGRVLGFTTAWVIAYVNPGQSGKVRYDLSQNLGFSLNIIDYKVDRYELDRSQTHNWDPVGDSTHGTWIPSPPISTTFDINAHYQLPVPNDSSFVFDGGIDYEVNDQILIQGSQIGGVNGANDVIITVSVVDVLGTIIEVFCKGTAPISSVGEVYTNITGINILGSGTSATWDLIVTGGTATIFDGSSTTFNAPADRWTGTDEFDKYLVFPKTNILG